ncbi:TPA: hypothetical protein QHR34_002833 [Raoultella ornithinolytica]|nr:hypothetical protein [Raoultella ornithinolytica]HDT1248688.1 hypothetical protein [Raoultella ornithinolytica]
MTSKLTITDDKLSALLSEMQRSFTGCKGHGYTGAAEEYADMISALRELQERRKAEQDSEPVAQIEVLSGVLVNERWMHQSLPNGWHDLFACRHAQQALECQHQWRHGGANKLQNQNQCIKCGRVELDAQPAPVEPGDGHEQFEEWFKFHYGDEHSIVKLHRANGGANYRDPHVDLAWIAWKDSRAAMLNGGKS